MDRNSIIGWTLMAILMFMLINTNSNMRKKQETNKPATEQVESTADQTNDNTVTNTNNTNEPAVTNNTSDTTVISAEVADSLKSLENNATYGIFGAHASGNEEDVVIENDVLAITFTNKGGVPKSVILKDYKTHDQAPLEVYNLEGGVFNLKIQARGTKNGNIFTDSLYFKPTITKTSDAQIVNFKLQASNGKSYEHVYTIPNEGYLIDFDIKMNKLQDFVASEFIDLQWAQVMPSQEGNLQAEKMYSSVYYADKNLKVDKLGYRKSGEKDLKTDPKWVSFKQKFFNSTIIAEDHFSIDGSFIASQQPEKEDIFVKKVSTNLSLNYVKRDDFTHPMQLYFGPNKYKDLKALDIKLERVVQLGVSIFRWVNLYLIMPAFNFLNNYIGNYGIIILILTLFIKMLVFPLTYKSHLSMIKMRVLQPELAELKKKFGKDQAKLGPAQMDLYRKAGVNPLGGCLPMLFQMPILIAMYRFFPSSIELRQESFLWANDLSTYDAWISWSAHIPLLSDFLGNHLSLFTILMGISSFFYTRLNSQNTPVDSSNPMAAQMRTFQYIMPFMMIFIFNKFSAALSYYYLLFNLFSIAQHLYMKRFMIDEDKIHAQIQENKVKVKKKSKWQMRMEEMMKQQQEMKNKKR